MRTTGNTIFVDGITVIVHRKFYAERNKCFFKSNFTEKRFADFNRVKSSITKKSLRGDKGMLLKEINQDRKQGFLIGKRFILIRRVRFLFHYDIRMSL